MGTLIPRGWGMLAAGLALTIAAPCIAQREQAEVSATLQRLREAERADRMNSTSWTADNPTLDHYYARKAAEVAELIGRLERGEKVEPADIDRALDTSEARRY